MKDVQETHQSSKKVQIEASDEGQRLDNFLIKSLKNVPKSRIYRMIRKGEVRINGKRAKPHAKLSLADWVRLPPMRVATSMPKQQHASFLSSMIFWRKLSNTSFLTNAPASQYTEAVVFKRGSLRQSEVSGPICRTSNWRTGLIGTPLGYWC